MKQESISSLQHGRAQRPRSSIAAVLLVAGLAGGMLYIAHAAFVPIALAVLFALLLSGPVEGLHRRRVPRSLSALLIVVLFLSIVGGTVDLLWTPAQTWLAAAPRTAQVIQRRLGPAARIMQRIDAVTNRAGHLTDGTANGAAASPAPLTPAGPESGGLVVQTREFLLGFVTVGVLTLFLLAAGPPVLARMSAAFASDNHAMHVLRVIQAVRGELGRYYSTLALINIGLGASTAAVMWALGMPNPVLCGAVAGVLNFIPYVGSAMTFFILTIVAFVSFDGVGRVFAVAGSYLALATIEGQLVQPVLVGHRLELNPIIVFLALWFGGWFWAIPGIILAIPSLVALKVVAEHSEYGAPLVEFLSPGKAKRFKPRREHQKESAKPKAA
jgi:predicted PurR-regulated permease PerM